MKGTLTLKPKRRKRSDTFQKTTILPAIVQLDSQCKVNENSTLRVDKTQNTANHHNCYSRRSISFQLQLDPLTSENNRNNVIQKRVQQSKKAHMHQLILNILNGQFSLPDLINMHSTVTVIKILKNKRMHQNAGWFQSFVNSKDLNGNTALHIVAQTKSVKLAKTLLKYNALENVLNNSKETPLDLAAIASNFEICLLLLKSGSILGPTMYENEIKLQYCNDKIVQLLKSYNQPSRQMQIGLLSSPTTSIYVPPLHMYEVPFEFKSEQNQLQSNDYNISEYISNVSPTPSARITNPPYNYSSHNANKFFDSFVDFH